MLAPRQSPSLHNRPWQPWKLHWWGEQKILDHFNPIPLPLSFSLLFPSQLHSLLPLLFLFLTKKMNAKGLTLGYCWTGHKKPVICWAKQIQQEQEHQHNSPWLHSFIFSQKHIHVCTRSQVHMCKHAHRHTHWQSVYNNIGEHMINM